MARRAIPNDTSPEAERFLVEGYRRMSMPEKAKRLVNLVHAGQQLALARIRAQYPDASPREQQLRLASLWIDAETMRAAFGWDPEKEGY